MARQEQLVVSPELEELLGFIDQPHEERVKHADRIRELAMMPDAIIFSWKLQMKKSQNK